MPLSFLLALSVKNLFRYRRRNTFLLAAIAFAVGGVTVSNSLVRGWQADMLHNAVNNLTGHIKMQAPGFSDQPSMQRSFALQLPPQLPGPADQYLGWSARIKVPAVIMSARETRGVQLVGINPAREYISFYQDLTVDGEALSGSDDGRILIGAEMADSLETKLGRRLVLLVEGADGKSRELGVRVSGIFAGSGTTVERMFIFTGLSALQDLVMAPDEYGSSQVRSRVRPITELSILLADESLRLQVAEALTSAYPQLESQDWQSAEPAIAELYRLSDAVMFIWFLLMMSALAFGLVNTLIAAVMERVNELGLLRALGMSRPLVLLQVVIESCVVVTVGVLLGLLIGVVGIDLLSEGIDLSAFSEGIEAFGMGSRLVPLLRVDDLLMFGGMSVFVGLLASFFPALRAMRISPLAAMNR